MRAISRSCDCLYLMREIRVRPCRTRTCTKFSEGIPVVQPRYRPSVGATTFSISTSLVRVVGVEMDQRDYSKMFFDKRLMVKQIKLVVTRGVDT